MEGFPQLCLARHSVPGQMEEALSVGAALQARAARPMSHVRLAIDLLNLGPP